jgi:prepilin-type N-terminal cleavage/methylation domain-containing protein
MKSFFRDSRHDQRGYTLSEILIAMSLSVVVLAAATWFMVEGTRASMKTTNNSINDLSQWSIFTAISVDSKVANGMEVYRTFTAADMSDPTKRLDKDQRGNVLILTRSHQVGNSRQATYDQITGYIYSATTKNLRKFVYTVPPSEQGNPATGTPPATLEQILVNNLTNFAPGSIADNVNKPDAAWGGVFLVRQKGQSGILTIESVQGEGNTHSVNKKLIDAAFFIRG